MIQQILVTFIMGCLFGVLEGWNKKVALCVWIGLAVAVSLLYFTSATTGDMTWFEGLVGIASAWFGIFCGKRMYKGAFGVKK